MPTLLGFAPHPDDETYAFGPLVWLAGNAGWRTVIVAATQGEAGQRHDGGPTRAAALAVTRRAEFEASCAVLGAEPQLWALPDGGLRHLAPPTARIMRLFGDLRPDVVVTLGEDGAYGHPDHVALHRWVRGAWASHPQEGRPALLFAAFPPGLFLPQYHLCAAMMGDPPDPPPAAIGGAPWHYEVPAGAAADAAWRALACHRSQLPGGDPGALFPAGIVETALSRLRLADATGAVCGATLALLRSFAPGAVAVNRGIMPGA